MLIKIPNPNDDGVKMYISIVTKNETHKIISNIYFDTETGEIKFIVDNKESVLETIEKLKNAEPTQMYIIEE